MMFSAFSLLSLLVTIYFCCSIVSNMYSASLHCQHGETVFIVLLETLDVLLERVCDDDDSDDNVDDEEDNGPILFDDVDEDGITSDEIDSASIVMIVLVVYSSPIIQKWSVLPLLMLPLLLFPFVFFSLPLSTSLPSNQN